eukprot:CAMPEP_0171546870 /NCGR_PEP_ID=MMETSP0960-20121227/4875_1 /TAXON_ID=87120 /ORGANISM="Aurantiochytrium limacinum, Strain ATCCMYA-1381" /LENGTH=82 /DNA_ID=CAMNT_0012094995 /DNA_START=768 /DNA_END=1013 /DNA_ORIENTATION=+
MFLEPSGPVFKGAFLYLSMPSSAALMLLKVISYYFDNEFEDENDEEEEEADEDEDFISEGSDAVDFRDYADGDFVLDEDVAS